MDRQIILLGIYAHINIYILPIDQMVEKLFTKVTLILSLTSFNTSDVVTSQLYIVNY